MNQKDEFTECDMRLISQCEKFITKQRDVWSMENTERTPLDHIGNNNFIQ